MEDAAVTTQDEIRGAIARVTLTPALWFVFMLAAVSPALAQSPCDQLKLLALPNATVTSTQSVKSGLFRPPGAPPESPALQLPAHCRVALTLTPSADSDIKTEVWLPVAADWNGKLLMEGGGGFVGYISYGQMAA